MTGNLCKWLEVAGKGQKVLEISENGWKWLEWLKIARTCWKSLDMTGMAGKSLKWLLVVALGPKNDFI